MTVAKTKVKNIHRERDHTPHTVFMLHVWPVPHVAEHGAAVSCALTTPKKVNAKQAHTTACTRSIFLSIKANNITKITNDLGELDDKVGNDKTGPARGSIIAGFTKQPKLNTSHKC